MLHTCVGVIDIGPKFYRKAAETLPGTPVTPVFIVTYAVPQQHSIVEVAASAGLSIVPTDNSMKCFMSYPSTPVGPMVICEGPDPCAVSLYHQTVQNAYHLSSPEANRVVSSIACTIYNVLRCTSVYLIINHAHTVFVPSATYIIDLAERTTSTDPSISSLKQYVLSSYKRIPWTEDIDPFPVVPHQQ